MRKKYGIAISLIATLAALVLVLIIGLVSIPSIIYIGLKHLRYKIKLKRH
jgi:hypothetical protein